MGYKYVEIMCDNCRMITVHQVRRAGSPTNGIRRTVTKCLSCQSKLVEPKRRAKYRLIGERKFPINKEE